MITVPILIIGFNRPEVIQTTFEFIRTAQPSKIYCAVDGARSHVEGEKQKVDEVKSIVSNIDWPCEKYFKFNEENKGAEVTVSSAISWVLEKEECVIILEDDIIAPMSFLKFAQQMLFKYKDDERIAIVTGSNFTPIPFPNNEDYCFAKYGHTWGWATWRRYWKEYDLSLEIPKEHTTLNFCSSISTSIKEAKYYQRLFKNMRLKGPGKNTWDFTALYHFRAQEKFSIIPRVNLTSNIGIYGLHARGLSEHHFRPYDTEFLVNLEPSEFIYFDEYDKHHFENYINTKRPLLRRVFNKFKKILKVKSGV